MSNQEQIKIERQHLLLLAGRLSRGGIRLRPTDAAFKALPNLQARGLVWCRGVKPGKSLTTASSYRLTAKGKEFVKANR